MDKLGSLFGIYSSGAGLPWLWIIEYLSSFPQIDASIIRGLIQNAPVLPEELGENTSERVALRCLEEIFGPKNGLENVASPESRVAFDLSSSCDDVLEHILQEVSLSNLKKAGPELLRWDAQPFIMHKRATLPKCALEQLKGSILEKFPVLDGEGSGPTSRFDNSDDENGNQEGNLIPQISKNDNEVLQDGLLEGDLLPSKRCINDSVAGNLVGLFSVNQDSMDNDLHSDAKQDATCTIQSVEQNPIRLLGEGQVEDKSQMTIEVTEIEGNNIRKDSQAGEGDQDGSVALRTLEQSNAVSHVELQDNQMENVRNADADIMVEQKDGDREYQNVVMDESNNAENDALQKCPSGDSCENIENATCTIQSVEQNSIRLHGEGQVEDESQMIIEVTEIEGNNIEKDSQAGEDDQNVHVASRTIEQSNAVSHVELLESQMENVENAEADVTVEQKCGDTECQNVVMDENGALKKDPSGDACENIDQGFPLSSPKSTADGLQQTIDLDQAKADMEHPCAEQICENEDERLNIALEKNLFLSSQCRPGQDPVGKAGWTEQNLCIKCKQEGQMLACSSSDCPLVVHESCLDSAPRFDDKNNFYCPFCAYSLAISEYLEAKDKTYLAGKDLAAFMKLCSKKTEELRKEASESFKINGDEELVFV